jgi:hypothetical protein
MNKYLLYGIIFLLSPLNCLFSQKVENVRVLQVSDQIHVFYDLSEVDENRILKIEINVSDNGGSTYEITPISIFGDIGIGISPGINKKIVWDVLNDFEALAGTDFRFKISAKYLTTESNTKAKKGKYLSLLAGYGNLDRTTDLTATIKGCIYLKKLPVGLSLNGFSSNSMSLSWAKRNLYGIYSGIFIEPVLINSLKIDLFFPVSLGAGLVSEKFVNNESSDKNVLRMFYLESGLGADYKLTNTLKLLIECKFIISNPVEFYDVLESNRLLYGITVNIGLKIGSPDIKSMK